MCPEKTRSGSGLVGSVMVVGGGIAGVQAALDLADSGYYVHMVESSPAIGGVMAFPGHWRSHGAVGQDLSHQRLLHVYFVPQAGGVWSPSQYKPAYLC